MRNIEKTCRFCLNSLDELGVDIFLDENVFKIINQLKEILVVQLEDTPNWPRNACPHCIDFLMQLKRFKDLIHSSYDTLKRERDIVDSAGIANEMIKDDPDIKDIEEPKPQITEEPIDPVPESKTPAIVSDDCSEMDTEDDNDQDTMSVDDTIEEATETFTPLAGFDIKFPISDHDVFLKVQDDLQRNEKFANSLKEHFKAKEQLDLYFGMDILQMYSASGYARKIKISSSPLFMCVADAWTSDNRPLSVVVADIGIEIPKIISKSKSRKAYNRDRKREYRKRKSVQAPSTSTSSSIVRYWNPPMNEEEAELEKIMIDMKIFVCNYCDENCETFSGLKRHVRKEHANQFGNYEVCCNKTLKTQDAQSLYDHIRLHLNKESFKCPDCGKCVESKAILNSHILNLHTESSAKFVCDTCGIGFSSYSLLSHHLRRKHKPKFKCSYCQLELATKYTMLNHVQKQHENVVNFLCDICGKGYPTNNQLYTHIMDHGGPHGGRRKKKLKPIVPKVTHSYNEDYFKRT